MTRPSWLVATANKADYYKIAYLLTLTNILDSSILMLYLLEEHTEICNAFLVFIVSSLRERTPSVTETTSPIFLGVPPTEWLIDS